MAHSTPHVSPQLPRRPEPVRRGWSIVPQALGSAWLLVPLLCAAACGAEGTEPPAPTPAAEATPVLERAPATAEPPGRAVHGGGSKPGPLGPGAMARMPNDSIHAGLGGGPPAAGLPAGHPPIGGDQAAGAMGEAPSPAGAAPRAASAGVESEGARPLPLEGPGGKEELTARLAAAEAGGAGEATRARLEDAFRRTFTATRANRDYPGAAELLAPMTADAVAPTLRATAHRILGYVAVNTGFDVDGAMRNYGRAVELEDGYGEAHYALAFMHLMGDKATGKRHFDRATALGVKDTRGLAGRFAGVP